MFPSRSYSKASSHVIAISILAFSFTGCVLYRSVDEEYALSPRAMILNIPLIKQTKSDCCGSASLAMVLRYWDADPELVRSTKQMACPKFGFTGVALKRIASDGEFRSAIFKGTIYDVKHHLDATRPLIAMLGKLGRRHYVVLSGYSKQDDRIILTDPSRGLVYLEAATFLDLWSDSNRFLLLVVPKTPKTNISPIVNRESKLIPLTLTHFQTTLSPLNRSQ